MSESCRLEVHTYVQTTKQSQVQAHVQTSSTQYHHRYKRMYKPQVHKTIIRTCSHKRTSPRPKILERHLELEGMVCPVRMVGIKNYLQLNISTYSFRYMSMNIPSTITGTSTCKFLRYTVQKMMQPKLLLQLFFHFLQLAGRCWDWYVLSGWLESRSIYN